MKRALGAAALAAVLLSVAGCGKKPAEVTEEPVVEPAAEVDAGEVAVFHDDAGVVSSFLNILPAGQDGLLNGTELVAAQGGTFPPFFKDQFALYEALVFRDAGPTEAELTRYFKPAPIGAVDGGRVYSPVAGATVTRDPTFSVPHIEASTRYAAMYAQGYTTAEDRLFLMDILRHLGRARLAEFLGASEANMHMDREQLLVAPYQESDLTAQLSALLDAGAESALVVSDLRAYADGVNAYINQANVDVSKMPGEYAALQATPQPWTAEDAVAIASLVGAIFGKGGGGELQNACGLKAMTALLSSRDEALTIFRELHFLSDPEAPSTSRLAAPFHLRDGVVQPESQADLNCDSLRQIETTNPPPYVKPGTGTSSGRGGIFGGPTGMSNALLVTGAKSLSGHPIAVFGPQTGYFQPQLLVEKSVRGPGISARGAAFAGTDVYVQLGHGNDFAWSATSASADNIDHFVLKLCETGLLPATTSSMGYRRGTACVPIDTWQHVQLAKPTAGGLGLDVVLSWRVERAKDYGPLVARGTLADGTPVAIAVRRSTYGAELQSAVGFLRVNDPNFMTNGFSSFSAAMAGVDYTFNWFFVDATSAGYQHSGKLPLRAAGTHPDFPTLTTGNYDWQGELARSAHPAQLNPAEGFITSWNNKQAPFFGPADNVFSYGPVYRSLLLDRRLSTLAARGAVRRHEVVEAMASAATVDLRAEVLLPLILEVMGPNAPADLDPRLPQMRQKLSEWVQAGGERRDANRDGSYENAVAVAIMDAFWAPLVLNMFDTRSGKLVSNLNLETHDGPQKHVGSAFNGGFYGQVHKDLRRALGRPGPSPFSRGYCGAGELLACRRAVWEALSTAAGSLTTEFGSADFNTWQRRPADDQINFSAAGVATVPAMAWHNRPTFQQVVEVTPP